MIPVRTRSSAIPIACLFASGFAGLVYEVCWIRRAALAFGSTTYALGTVLAVFFLGLAVGSHVFGRFSTRMGSPLRVYALVELGVAALALATLPGFDLAERAYGHVYRSLRDQPAVHGLLRFVLVALVLVPATFLMGGTLPLFSRSFATIRSRITAAVGGLYAVNTLGAALGCAVTGLVLLPAWGLRASMTCGAVISAFAGVVVLVTTGAIEPAPATPEVTVATRQPGDARAARREKAASPPTPIDAWVFMAGFAALGYEVLWPRVLALLVRSTVTTITLTLTTILAGIVIGSGIASRWFDRSSQRGSLFGAIQMLFGLVVLGIGLIPVKAWSGVSSGGGIITLLLLPPAVLSGALFPLAVRMIVEDPGKTGAAVGRITAVNTLGGIAGSLVMGFVVLPRFGLQASLLALTGASVVAGALAWTRFGVTRAAPVRWIVPFAAAAVWIALPPLLGTRLPADFLPGDGQLVDYREGLEANLAVVRREGRLTLEIDRWWQGQDSKTHQVMAAHVPMILHAHPRSVLVVGVGTGQTASRVLMYPIERMDAIDIEPAVFDLIRPHFDSAWMSDPRVHLIREDGRNYLDHAAARYDVISLEVGQVFRPGIASFYTTEFYRRTAARLHPGGIVCQFVPLPFLTPDAFRSIIRTFVGVFPQSSLWYNTSELLLVGGPGMRLPVDRSRAELLSANAAVHEDLQFSHWGGRRFELDQPEVFMAGFLAGPPELARLSAGAPLLSDDHPVLEYVTRDVSSRQMNELPVVDRIRHELAPMSAAAGACLSAEGVARADSIRVKNLNDIRAEAYLRQFDEQKRTATGPELEAILSRVLAANPENVKGLRLMGDLLMLDGKPDDAPRYYATALELDPDDALANRGLAIALHRQGRFDEAIAHYEAAIRSDSTDAEANANLGAALAAQGRLADASARLERALTLRPGFAEAERNLAKVRSQLEAARK